MATDLIEIDAERPSETAIERAAAAVRRGDVVAIPTDALYTLVADPVNLHAVGRVFAAKGRDIHRALPLLVSDVIMAEELAKEMSARFRLLARYFWPGALTIIAPASSRVPLKVTGNTGRIAMRQSKSKVANALLERLAQPLISTSANLSGHADLRQRHRMLRHDGRTRRPGPRRWTRHRHRRDHGRRNRALLARHQRRRDRRERNRRGPERNLARSA